MSEEIGTEIRGRHKTQEAYRRIGVGYPRGDDKSGRCVLLLIKSRVPHGSHEWLVQPGEIQMTRNQQVLYCLSYLEAFTPPRLSRLGASPQT